MYARCTRTACMPYAGEAATNLEKHVTCSCRGLSYNDAAVQTPPQLSSPGCSKRRLHCWQRSPSVITISLKQFSTYCVNRCWLNKSSSLTYFCISDGYCAIAIRHCQNLRLQVSSMWSVSTSSRWHADHFRSASVNAGGVGLRSSFAPNQGVRKRCTTLDGECRYYICRQSKIWIESHCFKSATYWFLLEWRTNSFAVRLPTSSTMFIHASSSATFRWNWKRESADAHARSKSTTCQSNWPNCDDGRTTTSVLNTVCIPQSAHVLRGSSATTTHSEIE